MPLNHTSKYSDLTDAQYEAIGRAVVEWANVEFLLGEVLARLLATPAFLALTYTDSISAARLQDAILEATEIHERRYGHRLVTSSVLQEIRVANNRVTSLRGLRNKLAHFCWMRTSDEELSGTAFRGGVLSAKKERRDYANLTSSDLVHLNKEAHSLVDQLIGIVEKLPEVTEESLLAGHYAQAPSTESGLTD